MEVDLAVLADAANKADNGKLNVLGIFDNFTLGPEFPASTPTFAIVFRVVLHPSELGKHDLLIRFADADGKELAKIEGQIKTGRKKPSPKPARVPVIFQAQLKVPAPGEYVFDILVDGRWEKALPIEVKAQKS